MVNAYSVYVHINKLNEKKYVGITSRDVNIRWANGHGYSDRLPIGRAIRKYGWNNFIHLILYSDLSEDKAKEIEKEFIAKWKTQDPEFGYNVCAGGDGVKGWKPSEETRRKISESAKKRVGELNPNYGHRWTPEMRAAASIRQRRENLSAETLRRMSEAAKERNKKYGANFQGKHHSDETKRRLSEAKSRAVKMYDLDGNYIRDFPSIKKAAEITNGSKVGISNCCRGVTKTSGGYVWKYSDSV